MNYKKFYLLSVLGVILASFYPIYMLIKVLSDYVGLGAVNIENYPKYIIPYAPISAALILSICLIPLGMKLFKKLALLILSAFGVGAFFICELILEKIVVIDGTNLLTSIENWQMLSCYAPPGGWRVWTAGDILVGNYNPAFKMHFYIISIIIILSILNVIYGFSKMIKDNNFVGKNPLVAQAISIAAFVGLCIFACFTAFYRTGTAVVPPLSAILMSLFFITMGVTSGIYIGSFFYKKSKILSVTLPAIIALATTLIMYIGELILLNGKLYLFGSGFLFEPLGAIPFAIIDLIVILLSGAITYFIMKRLKPKDK